MRDRRRIRGLFGVCGVLAAIAVLVLAMTVPAAASSDGSSPTGTSTITPGSGGSLSDQITVSNMGGATITYVNVTFSVGTTINSVSPTVTITPAGGGPPVSGTCSMGGTLGPATASCGFQAMTTGFTYTMTIVTSQPVPTGSTVTMYVIGGGNTYGPFAQTWAAAPCPTITITPATLPNPVLGANYTQTFSATPAAMYSFSGSGDLPPGTGVSSDGMLSGVPTQPGTFTFNVIAFDAQSNCSGTMSYTLTVAPPLPLLITKQSQFSPVGPVQSEFDLWSRTNYRIKVTNPNAFSVDADMTDALPPGYASVVAYSTPLDDPFPPDEPHAPPNPETQCGRGVGNTGPEITCKQKLGAGESFNVWVGGDFDTVGVFTNTADVVGTDVYGNSTVESTTHATVTVRNPRSKIKGAFVLSAESEFTGTAFESPMAPAGDVRERAASSGASPIRLVQIALLRLTKGTRAVATFARAGAGCRWLSSARAAFSTRAATKGACDKPIWLRASGTSHWTFKLLRSLPAGSYVVYSRATDTAGVSEVLFTAKLRNRLAFSVH